MKSSLLDHGFHGRTLATMSASEPNLEQAQIYCVGEQLEHFFAARLGTPPKGLHWDAESLRLWLPIDAWMREFHAGETSQYLQISNWLDRYTHMRRLSLIPIMPEPLKLDLDIKGSAQRQSFPPQRKGLVCPYCTPEGRNIGRLLDIARGATIKDGKLIRTDESPLNQLGFSASMVPFLEHDDTNRALMGINRCASGRPIQTRSCRCTPPAGRTATTTRRARTRAINPSQPWCKVAKSRMRGESDPLDHPVTRIFVGLAP